MLIYAAMFAGREALALEHAADMEADLLERAEALPDFWDEMKAFLESFVPMRLHVLLRFGRWRAVLDDAHAERFLRLKTEDGRPEHAVTAATMYLLPRGSSGEGSRRRRGRDVDIPRRRLGRTTEIGARRRYYARGVAKAALGDVAGARAERSSFRDARDDLARRDAATGGAPRVLMNNLASVVLNVAAKVLDGEILYRERRYADAFEALREGVALNDGDPSRVFDVAGGREASLVYDEPWGWMMPARHALGALLLERARASGDVDGVDEAERVYRADLGLCEDSATVPHPHNIWAVTGLVECLDLRANRETGDAASALAAERGALATELARLRRTASVEVTSSCCCARGASS